MWQDRILGETEDGFGFVLKDEVNDLGYQSITTPGTLKAFEEAHKHYGSLPWSRILEPAIAFASDGYVLAPEVYYYWVSRDAPGRVAVRDRLAFSAPGRAIYCAGDGTPKPIGSLIQNPDMARTYQRIADEGADVFYEGEIASMIDADMKAHGGLLSARDLKDYRTIGGEPLWGSYRGLTFSTNRPPGGGIMLVEMLNILESFDLAAMGHNSPEYMRVVAEAMKIATSDKDNFVGDPAFVDVPVDRLTDKDYAAEHALAIERGDVARVERLGLAESAGTTHISVTDAAGNAVSMTHSLGMMSGVITEGLGFMYNGCMAVFDPRPGRAGSLAPGKARFSSVCPTILFADGEPWVILGAPGGTQIAMGVLQVILNVVDFGMPIQQAVLAPRFSATSDTITVTARIPRYGYEALERRGYRVVRSPYSYEIASVQALKREADGWTGASDIPYGGGMALGV
jgi:gamma-glutamyltranspeptidase/glutathione hydrolase